MYSYLNFSMYSYMISKKYSLMIVPFLDHCESLLFPNRWADFRIKGRLQVKSPKFVKKKKRSLWFRSGPWKTLCFTTLSVEITWTTITQDVIRLWMYCGGVGFLWNMIRSTLWVFHCPVLNGWHISWFKMYNSFALTFLTRDQCIVKRFVLLLKKSITS